MRGSMSLVTPLNYLLLIRDGEVKLLALLEKETAFPSLIFYCADYIELSLQLLLIRISKESRSVLLLQSDLRQLPYICNSDSI